MATLKLEKAGDKVGFAFTADVQQDLGPDVGQEWTLTKIDGGIQLVRSNPELERQFAVARQVLREQAGVLKALADFDQG